MNVIFANSRLQRDCCDMARMTRVYGPDAARRLAQRMQELEAVDTLADMRMLPGTGAHELKGSRKGQVSLRIHGSLRLIVVPAMETIPTSAGGGLAWDRVDAVRVQEIVDYH